MTPHIQGFYWILEMTLLGGCLDPQEGSWCDMRGQKFKKYDRRIKQILLIPNNLCFGSILEVILLHGCLDPSEGSWGHG